MNQEINDIDIWNDGAPVIIINSEKDFDLNVDGAPVVIVTQDNTTPPVTLVRRRSFIF
jgi:hypothetical protein